MKWEPQEQSLRNLVITLRDASNPKNPDYKLMKKRLLSFNEYPDYNAYLVYIFTNLDKLDFNTRELSGKILLENIKTNFNQIPVSTLEYIKETCLNVIKGPDMNIISTINLIITSIIKRGQLSNWIQMIFALVENLDSSNKVIVNYSIDTLVTLCQERAPEIDKKMNNGIRLSNILLPKFISFYSNSDSYLKHQSIKATSQFITFKSKTIVKNLDDILYNLHKYSFTENDVDVRQESIRLVSSILEVFPLNLSTYIDLIIQFMLNALIDDHHKIKLAACDFWLQFAHTELFEKELSIYYSTLVDRLLKLMVYSSKDIANIEYNDYYHLEYRANTSSISNLTRSKSDSTALSNGSCFTRAEFDLWDDEDENTTVKNNYEDFYFSEEEDVFDEESLREASALALDVLSVSFNITPTILYHLEHNCLFSQNWLVKESGILALGAAAEGGIMVIRHHLNRLVPYLLNSLEDPTPLVRSMSCWVLSRFSKWLVEQHDLNEESCTLYFKPVIYGLLHKMLDPIVRVQELACTALIIITEASSTRIIPFILPILSQSYKAFTFYNRKNTKMLYDLLETLADIVKSELNQPEFIRLLIPPLMNKWNELSDDDTDLFPLLKCLSGVSAALGSGFMQFVNPVLSRCLTIIISVLYQQSLADSSDVYKHPNVEFLITALELLSGLVRGLGEDIGPLLLQTNPPLIPLLIQCIYDPVSGVQQSTYLLIGDIAVSSFRSLEPSLPSFFRGVIDIVSRVGGMISGSVYNNILWSVGEIAMRWKENMQPYVVDLVKAFIPLLTHAQELVRENATVALGRLSLACPGPVSPKLSSFFKPWIVEFIFVKEKSEKDSAFRGLCAAIKLNTDGVQENLALLFVAISSFEMPSETLSNEFRYIVNTFRSLNDEQEWERILSQLDEEPERNIRSLVESN